MAHVRIDRTSVEQVLRASASSDDECARQHLGLRLLRTLVDLAEVTVDDGGALALVQPLDEDPTSDVRYGWPGPTRPELVEIVWPPQALPREPLAESLLRVSPWALHSLLLGEWGEVVPGSALRLPKAITLLMCDGLVENPAGRDLKRITGQLEVLTFPTQLHSQLLVCGLADGSGKIEIEVQVLGPENAEVGFLIRGLFLPAQDVASFYVCHLDALEVRTPGRYWFVLRTLGEELCRLPIELGTAGSLQNRGGWEFGQAWTWEGQAFFGERD